MESTRIAKVNELIRSELAMILAREVEFPLEALPTITRVDTDQDMKHAKILISVLPEEAEAEVLAQLKKQRGSIQYLLNHKLAMQYVPAIHFVRDDKSAEREEAEMHDIETLLDSIAAEQTAE